MRAHQCMCFFVCMITSNQSYTWFFCFQILEQPAEKCSCSGVAVRLASSSRNLL
jgi:hypothetical protein